MMMIITGATGDGGFVSAGLFSFLLSSSLAVVVVFLDSLRCRASRPPSEMGALTVSLFFSLAPYFLGFFFVLASPVCCRPVFCRREKSRDEGDNPRKNSS